MSTRQPNADPLLVLDVEQAFPADPGTTLVNAWRYMDPRRGTESLSRRAIGYWSRWCAKPAGDGPAADSGHAMVLHRQVNWIATRSVQARELAFMTTRVVA